MNSTKNLVICRHTEFRVSDYEIALEIGDVQSFKKIAEAIKVRFQERYIWPCTMSSRKNGFIIMASCCLLIEGLEAFKNGWDKTPSNSKAFRQFFNRVESFKDFKPTEIADDFYENIRCGILHQGEVRNGWRIRRDLKKLVDLENRVIDANVFIKHMNEEIISYSTQLKRSPPHKAIWIKAIDKLNFVMKNCIAE